MISCYYYGMKRLEDYADDINKCSKCGLCQSVCPVYKITGNDCAVSKGKFVMLEGVLKGDLELTKTINKYLEMCLKCGKCTAFCPSGIDVCEIFQTAKAQYLEKSLEGKFVDFWQSEILFDNLIKICQNFHRVPGSPTPQNPVKTFLFFNGCMNNVNPASERAIKKIFASLPYALLENSSLKCCGVPFLSAGNLDRYENVMGHNTSIINSSECDAILTDCASCFSALSKYNSLNKPIMDFSEFAAQENIHFKFKNKLRVTFHKPCHYDNYEAVKQIFLNCENIEYLEMPDFDECCGFSGQFAITNRKLSLQLSRNKIKNALAVSPDVILTSCPACILGLKQGMYAEKGINFSSPKIMNITEFLAAADAYYR